MAGGRSVRSYHDDNGQRIFMLIGVLVTMFFFASLCEAQDEDYSSVSFVSSEGYLLPCVYRGIPHEHGEEWVINDCSTCVCTNATIECVIKGCPPHECGDAIHPPGTCCPMCPFHVNVSRVSPTAKVLSTPKILPGRTNKLSLNVSMIFKENKRTTGVHGHNLWNLTVWTSNNRQGEGFAYGVSKNVLTSDQRAQRYRKGKPFPKFKNVPFNLDATGLSCEDMRYICVRFDQADKPRHDNYEYVPFFFGGSPDDDSLTGCVASPRCKKLKNQLTPLRPTTTATPTTTSPTTTAATTTTPAPVMTKAVTTRPTRRSKVRLTNWPIVESTSIPEVTGPRARRPFGDTFTMRSSYVTSMPLSYVGGWPQDSGSNEVVHQPPQTVRNHRVPAGQRAQGGSSDSSGSQSVRRPGRRGSKRKTLSENALAAGLSSEEVELLMQKRRQQIRRRHRQKQEQELRIQQEESEEQYYQPSTAQQNRRQPQQQQYWRMQRQYEREREEHERQRQQYMQQQENYQRQLEQYVRQQRQEQNQRYLQQQQQQQQQQHPQGYPYGRVRNGQLNPLYQRAIDTAVAEGTLHVPEGRVASNQRQSAHPVVGMPFDQAYMPPNSQEQ